MNRLTYVFVGNRKEKYLANNIGPKDFFYGLTFYKKSKFNVEVIEGQTTGGKVKKILKLFDLFFKKIINLPVYMYDFLSLKNINIIRKSNKIILVNETTFCSFAPFLLLLKLFKKIDVYVFVMGLYSKKLKFPHLRWLHFFVIRAFVSTTTKILFLGEGEFKKALSIHPSLDKKFKLFPFYIDTKFWKLDENKHINEREYILFVGNDGNRDAHLFIELAKYFKNLKFVAVTKIQEIVNSNLKNVIVMQGSNQDGSLTDIELKEVYKDSKFVIIPLKETSQPSGQSVALQAMSCQRAVIISDTEGFWDRKKFIHDKNIVLVKNTITNWKYEISKLNKNIDKVILLENEGSKLVRVNLNQEIFETELNKLLEIKSY